MEKPKVVIFNGVSLDGRMDGDSQIDIGLYYQLASTWKAEAMLSGSNTMLAADAGQTLPDVEQVNLSEPKQLHPLHVPYLVVVDSRGRIQQWETIVREPFWREVVVLCSRATPSDYLAKLERLHIETIIAGDEVVDFAIALAELKERFKIQTVRVDSGGTLNGVLLRAGLVDEVSLLIGPTLVGGSTPSSIFVAPDLNKLEDEASKVIPLELISVETLQSNIVWLRYKVVT